MGNTLLIDYIKETLQKKDIDEYFFPESICKEIQLCHVHAVYTIVENVINNEKDPFSVISNKYKYDLPEICKEQLKKLVESNKVDWNVILPCLKENFVSQLERLTNTEAPLFEWIEMFLRKSELDSKELGLEEEMFPTELLLKHAIKTYEFLSTAMSEKLNRL